MPKNYTPEFKKKIVRHHLEEGHTYKIISAEYGISKASVSKWCSELREECQKQAESNPGTTTEIAPMKENLRLHKELEESRKENLFLKKRQHSLRRKSIKGLSIHRPISERIRYLVAAEPNEYLSECLL